MKTGTPPRIDGRSLNYALMEEQWGDENPGRFSYTDVARSTDQRCCWITYTNEKVHETLKEGFEKSPMFTGRIKGLVQDTALLSKIKLIDLPKEKGTKFL
eukprot:Opistho-1_new@107494